ncbi:hypothetical protein NUW58_g2293 [Xylaria curta]|uniref:Uncharacterized protein n=1 Tax=Xylaria curta TaxID=42375 RepID=A0ACC1PJJ0_9PEZI|nr:hypothetical protein NUW58_g2293 [Xylaria curta]
MIVADAEPYLFVSLCVARPEMAISCPLASPSTLYYECTLTPVFCIAPNALTNLKAKFKAVFRKKDKKAKEGESTAGTTEATKTEAPAAATAAAAAPEPAPVPAPAPAPAAGGEVPATEAAKTEEAAKPVTDTASGAVTEAKPEQKAAENPVAAADATAAAPAAAEIGVATDTKPTGAA